MKVTDTVLALALMGGIAACSGGKSGANASADTTSMGGGSMAQSQASAAAPSQMSMPDWMKVDSAAKTVTLDIHAGKTADNNHWNYNGYYNGDATITIPVGYKVTLNFTNDDPAMAHSLGVDSAVGNFPPAFTNPTPVFKGAITSNPTDMQKATQPGRSETLHFTADKAGNYSLNCYIPGHAVAGMWIHFNVSSEGKAGFTSSSS